MLDHENSALPRGIYIALDQEPWVYLITDKDTSDERLYVFDQNFIRHEQRAGSDLSLRLYWFHLESVEGLPAKFHKLQIQATQEHRFVAIGFRAAMYHQSSREA